MNWEQVLVGCSCLLGFTLLIACNAGTVGPIGEAPRAEVAGASGATASGGGTSSSPSPAGQAGIAGALGSIAGGGDTASGGASGSSAGVTPGATAGASGLSGGGPFDPRGHEGALFGGQTEAERLAEYYFAESGGLVVIEAEHFATQRYGADDYRGARWWMVNTTAVDTKSVPEFSDRCEMAQVELQNLDANAPGSQRSIRNIITNHKDSLLPGWEQVFMQFGCDPDASRAGAASGGQYIELLPDALYDNHDEIPHAGCNWYVPEQSPRVYYRAHFTQGGAYELWFRAVNSDTDSGDLHVGVAEAPGVDEIYINRVGPPRTGQWEWVQAGMLDVAQGQYWIVLGGREDGFEVDKLVATRVGCPACAGAGPDESGPFL